MTVNGKNGNTSVEWTYMHVVNLTNCYYFLAGFGRKDVVEHLLQNGANVHARDDGGLIPLHNACSFGHAEVVSLMLCQGADSNARDNWNYTPLHEAAIKGKIDVCIGKFLFFSLFYNSISSKKLACTTSNMSLECWFRFGWGACQLCRLRRWMVQSRLSEFWRCMTLIFPSVLPEEPFSIRVNHVAFFLVSCGDWRYYTALSH